MCGIFGIVTTSQQTSSDLTSVVDKALSFIAHRGPDGVGKWCAQSQAAAFGHVRLSIIDLEGGCQPMSTPDGRYTIVLNGEIYNYLELRHEIGLNEFVTGSDTEVVLRAFARWGPESVSRLRGMFAFAIWDEKERLLFLARDRFGIKPLYWSSENGALYFASEVKALLPFLKVRAPNPAALSDYFALQFCLGDKSLMQGVQQMPAAHYAILRPGEEPKPQRYWEVHYDIDHNHTESWFVSRLTELVDESIDMHLRADVEVGAYVSGGVDSSLVASLARRRRNGRFQAFNGRFLDGNDFDESVYAQALADDENMHLHIADIGENDFVENIAKVIWHLDQPTAGPGSFPQYMVSKRVGENIKVVLGGQGGDEIFGGYSRYLVAYFEQCIKGAIEGTLHNGHYVVTYDSIIPNLQTLRQYKPMLQEFWSKGLFEERDARYWRLVNRANTFGEIISPDAINQEQSFNNFKEIYWGHNVGKEAYFDSMTHFDFKTLLPALLQVEDRMSMAHGVEARVPFLDHPLVEFAATIPAHIKFKGGELKRLLRVAFGSQLPAAILERKDKMGFPVPLNLWLRQGGVARDFIGDILNSERAKNRPYLKPGFSVDKALDGQGAYGRNLWALISLELWFRQFIDHPIESGS